ncbi:hypothetical protein M3O96_05170 [Aquiflexum sp. TKW24L]|uniref:hypothetical protein n=1 Tax=Aquiflexum sp. TKW24L TaxID=2942212 RepID=UPI0020C08950|nr:hypothetical protein [Aquiflexum sp. TKW24L]MCL6258467.1 hypothetical protein [Aquiflexum sp. TKW24L]
MPIKNKLILLIFLFPMVMGLSSCQQDTVCDCEGNDLVYSNDFTDYDLNNIDNGRLFIFENKPLLGNYNNEEVTLNLSALPTHNIVKVTVELYVHDSWDGNPDNIGGPDYWFMKVDGAEVMRTTFSNTPCVFNFCLKQSYPANFFRQNLPKTGAIRTNLPGLCHLGGLPDNTTVYSVSQLVSHTGPIVKVTFGDELMQLNVPDPKCDESWSVGKIEVSTLFVM